MKYWSIIIIGMILDLGDGLWILKNEKICIEEIVYKFIVEKMSLYMIVKVVMRERDGIMMKFEDGIEWKKGMMKFENVEDLMEEIIGMVIIGRGRS